MKVSIITVAWNSSETIRDTIDSVNKQDYNNIEHILIDGNSSDNTVEIFKSFSTVPNIISSETDSGIYDAMNQGLKIATGEVIGFLNSDDFFANSGVISSIVTAFEKEVDLVHGNIEFIDKNNQLKRVWDGSNFTNSDFAKSMSPAHPTLYCKRHVFDKLNGFNLNYKIASDIDFMIRALCIEKFKIQYLNKVFVRMRLGGISTNSIISHLVITREVRNSFRNNNLSFNLIKYLIYKGLKAIKQKVR